MFFYFLHIVYIYSYLTDEVLLCYILIEFHLHIVYKL